MFKKYAFIAAVLLSSCLVAETAQAPTLQINGFTAMVAGSASQQNNLNGKGGGPHLGIGASNIFFTAKGKSMGGLQYKYRGAMESYPGGKSTSGNSIYFTQNYIEFLDNWGTFQVGNLTGPEDTMTESFFNLAGGALTIDGTFPNMINTSEGVISGVQMYGQTSKATKMVYYTPSLGGVQLGIAFTPNTTRYGMGGVDNSGASPDNTYGHESGIYPSKKVAPYGMNNVSLGINYKADFKDWNMSLAAIYIQENTKRGDPKWGEEGTATYDDGQLAFFKTKKVRSARSGQLTAAVGFGQWRFATGYINNGKSRIPKTKEAGYNSGDAGRAWNVGGQYTIGAYQFALGYFNTSRALPKLPANGTTYGAVSGKAKSDIVSATIDFNALQGLKFFGEVDFFKTSTDKNYAKFIGTTKKYTDDKKAITPSNSGMAGVIGAKLSF